MHPIAVLRVLSPNSSSHKRLEAAGRVLEQYATKPQYLTVLCLLLASALPPQQLLSAGPRLLRPTHPPPVTVRVLATSHAWPAMSTTANAAKDRGQQKAPQGTHRHGLHQPHVQQHVHQSGTSPPSSPGHGPLSQGPCMCCQGVLCSACASCCVASSWTDPPHVPGRVCHTVQPSDRPSALLCVECATFAALGLHNRLRRVWKSCCCCCRRRARSSAVRTVPAQLQLLRAPAAGGRQQRKHISTVLRRHVGQRRVQLLVTRAAPCALPTAQPARGEAAAMTVHQAAQGPTGRQASGYSLALTRSGLLSPRRCQPHSLYG